MPHYNMERRLAHRSWMVPFSFFMFEMILGGLILSLIELTPNPYEWSIVSYGLGIGWVVYTAAKLYRILARQRAHHNSHYCVEE